MTFGLIDLQAEWSKSELLLLWNLPQVPLHPFSFHCKMQQSSVFIFFPDKICSFFCPLMSYRAWRGCEHVYIRLVLRVRPRSKARGDKMCKKEYKAEQNCPEKWAEGAERQMCVLSAINPFNWNNSSVTPHYNCTQALSRWDVDAAGCAILVRPVVCTDLAASRPLPLDPVRGEEPHVRRGNLLPQRLCSRWKPIADRQESAHGFLQHDSRMPVFWLGIGLCSQRPCHGGVISISASCIRRRSLTHDIRSHGSPTSFGLRPRQSFTVNNISDAVRLNDIGSSACCTGKYPTKQWKHSLCHNYTLTVLLLLIIFGLCLWLTSSLIKLDYTAFPSPEANANVWSCCRLPG